MAGRDGPSGDDAPRGPAEPRADAGLKVFVSYSRTDVAFADDLVADLADRGFDTILDRHHIDPGEAWKQRLGGLILSADAVAFVLTEQSAGSPICAWEVEEAKRLGKRIVPVVPAPFSAQPPQALADLNWIHFYPTPTIPGSSMLDGMRKLERALRVDLAWLREQTRLSERAEEWRAEPAEDRLLRGAALKEAQDWLGRSPRDASVPVSVREYLAASADAEQGRETAARAQLAEREEALKSAEAAVKDRAKAVSRLRWVSVSSLVAGVALVAAAVALLVFAVQQSAEAGRRRADLFAQASEQLVRDGNPALAAMVAVAGDPTARSSWFESVLQPDGYPALRAALVRARTDDRLINTLPGQKADGSRIEIHDVAAIPDRPQFLTADVDNLMSLWTVGKATPDKTFQLPLPVNKLFPLPGGDLVVIAWDDGRRATSLWSLGKGEEVQAFGESPGSKNKIPTVAVDMPGKTVAVVGEDKVIRVWKIGEDKPFAELLGLIEAPWYMALGLFGDRLVSSEIIEGNTRQAHTRIAFWSLNRPDKPLKTVDLPGYPEDLSWNFRPARVVQSDGEVREIDPYSTDFGIAYTEAPAFPSDAKYIDTEFSKAPRGVKHVVDSPNLDFAMVFPRNYDDQPRLHRNYDDKNPLDLFPSDPDDQIKYAAFVPAAGAVVTVTETGRVSVWNIVSFSQDDNLAIPYTHDGKTYMATPGSVALGGGIALAASSGLSWTARPRKGVTRENWQGGLDFAENISISPDGQLVAGVTEDNTGLGIWRVGETRPVHVFPVSEGATASHVFSPDSKRLAFVSIPIKDRPGVLRVWDIAGARQVGEIPFPEHADDDRFVFAPDGEHVLVSTFSEVEMWRIGATTPEIMCADKVNPCLPESTTITAVAMAPDGSFALGAENGDLRLIDSKGQLRQAFIGHTDEVEEIAFSPDGRLMLSVSDDYTAKLWRVGQSGFMQSFDLVQNYYNHGDFDPDGQHVLIVTDDNLMRLPIDPVFFAAPDDMMKTACEWAAGRGFTGFTSEDRARLAILDGVPDNPCVEKGIIKPPPVVKAPAAEPAPN